MMEDPTLIMDSVNKVGDKEGSLCKHFSIFLLKVVDVSGPRGHALP